MTTAQPTSNTHYDLLEVSTAASDEVIRAAYRRLMRSNHPDVAGPTGEAKTALLNEAYRILGDADRRRDYDRSIRPEPAPAPAPQPRATGFHPAPDPVDQTRATPAPSNPNNDQWLSAVTTVTDRVDSRTTVRRATLMAAAALGVVGAVAASLDQASLPGTVSLSAGFASAALIIALIDLGTHGRYAIRVLLGNILVAGIGLTGAVTGQFLATQLHSVDRVGFAGATAVTIALFTLERILRRRATFRRTKRAALRWEAFLITAHRQRALDAIWYLEHASISMDGQKTQAVAQNYATGQNAQISLWGTQMPGDWVALDQMARVIAVADNDARTSYDILLTYPTKGDGPKG